MSEAAALRQSGASPLRSSDPDRIGPYAPLALLGSGGMGRVFLARSVDGGADLVAVKVIRPEYADDPGFRRRFEREASVHAQVRTPHAPRLCGTGFQDELLWMATEYLPAVDLADAVREGGALEPGSVWRLVAELGRALAALAAAEIVHRDLKPSNVLLSVRGAHVIDFGLSKAVDASALTGTGNRVGTPAYMSPEHLRTGVCTTASDVFSLAGTLVYALKGRAPFGDGTGVDVMHRVAFEEPNAELLGEISATDPELGSLLSACLTKEPERRPTPRDLVHTAGAHTRASAWPEPLHGQVEARQQAYEVLRRVAAERKPRLWPSTAGPSAATRPEARRAPHAERVSGPAGPAFGSPAGVAAAHASGAPEEMPAAPDFRPSAETTAPSASASPAGAAAAPASGSPAETATPYAAAPLAEMAAPAAGSAGNVPAPPPSQSPVGTATPHAAGSSAAWAAPHASRSSAEVLVVPASGSPGETAASSASESPAELPATPASKPSAEMPAAPAATPAPTPNQSPAAPARARSRKKPALTVAAGVTVCAVAAGVFVLARQGSPAAASSPGASVTAGGTMPGGAAHAPGSGQSGGAASHGESADGAASVDGGASRAEDSDSSEAKTGAEAGTDRRATPSSGPSAAEPGAPTAAAPSPSASATEPATPPWISDCTYYAGNGRTQQGDSGKRVLQVQCMLTKRGYSMGGTGVDGEFGPGTESAVRGFQSDNGLDADGIVGRQTWVALRGTT